MDARAQAELELAAAEADGVVSATQRGVNASATVRDYKLKNGRHFARLRVRETRLAPRPAPAPVLTPPPIPPGLPSGTAGLPAGVTTLPSGAAGLPSGTAGLPSGTAGAAREAQAF
jgi:hypothetical protein